MALRQHHGPKVQMGIRIPPTLRAQLIALSEVDRRSLNAFVVQRLEEGLKVWLDRQRHKRNPVEPEQVEDLTPANAVTGKQLRELQAAARQIEREFREGVRGGKPKLPTDLMAAERAQLGMKPVEEELLEGAPGDDDLDDTAGMSEEMLSVIEVLMGKREYVPPGLREGPRE